DLLERLPELLLRLHLMPAHEMHDAITCKEIEAKALGLAPLPAPPRASGALAGLPWTTSPSAVRTCRRIRPINAQHHYPTTKAFCGYRSDAPLDLVACWRHIQDGQALGHLIRDSVHPFAAKRQAR